MSLLHVPRSDAEARDLAAALASAVAALHARGRVHGRLHPGNVHVGADGIIALAEGGLPFRPDLADAAVLGFAAPELLRGGTRSRRTDAFSLAAIAYALLARRAPFEAGSPLETIRRVLHDDPIPLDALRPDLPAGLVAAVTRGLAKSAWRRATAKEIAEELTARAVPSPSPSPTATPTSTASSMEPTANGMTPGSHGAGHPERSVAAGGAESRDAASAAERSRGTPTPTSTSAGFPAAVRPERGDAAGGAESKDFTIQIGATQERAEADRIAARYRSLRPRVEAADVQGKGRWYRVRVGSFDTREAAERYRRDVSRETGVAGYVTASR
jgi:serine/threonine protein kinase